MAERDFQLPELERYQHELTVAIQAVRVAGSTILSQVNNRQAERHGLEFKAEVDRLADEAGVNIIKTAFPNDSVLTEEMGLPETPTDRLWVSDLLDGTTNFLNGSRNYTVLMRVSLLPATNELFYAVDGAGAFLNGKQIEVSSVDILKRATVALDPGYDPQGGNKVSDLFLKLRPVCGNVAMYNANGYTLSMLAKGELAGFVHFSSKVWEAAGLLLIKEAGGNVTDLEGQDIKLDFTSSEGFPFVASNGRIHKELLEMCSSKS